MTRENSVKMWDALLTRPTRIPQPSHHPSFNTGHRSRILAAPARSRPLYLPNAIHATMKRKASQELSKEGMEEVAEEVEGRQVASSVTEIDSDGDLQMDFVVRTDDNVVRTTIEQRITINKMFKAQHQSQVWEGRAGSVQRVEKHSNFPEGAWAFEAAEDYSVPNKFTTFSHDLKAAIAADGYQIDFIYLYGPDRTTPESGWEDRCQCWRSDTGALSKHVVYLHGPGKAKTHYKIALHHINMGRWSSQSMLS